MSNITKGKYPDFLIVGFQKCGTTALVSYLSQHHDIFIPKLEIHYYEKTSFKNLDWYKSHFKSGKINGEKSPSYVFHAKEIFKDNPNVKLIFLFRNPVKRAYSEYWMNIINGTETRPFEKSVFDSKKNYIKTGLYSNYVTEFLKYFDNSQMMFIISENFYTNRIKITQDVFSFIGVKNIRIKKMRDVYKGGLPKYDCLTKLTGILSSYMWNTHNSCLFFLIKRIIPFLTLINKKKGYPEINIEIENKLKEYFKPYNNELKELLNIDIDKFWGKQ